MAKTTVTVSKPRSTVAKNAEGLPIVRASKPLALGKPAKPGIPSAPKSAPKLAPKSVPIVAAPSNREKELSSEIAAMKGEIVKLSALAAKASKATQGRSADEITEGGSDLVEAKDWRLPYQGAIVFLKAHYRKSGNGSLELHDDRPSVAFLLAIPRDSDGSFGPDARATGELAGHFRTNEKGEYVGEPSFFNMAELTALWDDTRNG